MSYGRGAVSLGFYIGVGNGNRNGAATGGTSRHTVVTIQGTRPHTRADRTGRRVMEWPVDPSAVVSLEGFRSKRAKAKNACKHERYVLDTSAGIVECADCEAIISAFYALKKIAFYESEAFQRLHGMKAEIASIVGKRNWLRAVQKLDRLWRGGRMLPCCPHCKRGLFAEDMDGSSVGIEYERKRRQRDGERIPKDDIPPAPEPTNGE